MAASPGTVGAARRPMPPPGRRLAPCFGNTEAIAGVDLRVDRGAIHGLVGLHGAGR